jgi:hypothetical protein
MLLLERHDLNILELVKLAGNFIVVDGQDVLGLLFPRREEIAKLKSAPREVAAICFGADADEIVRPLQRLDNRHPQFAAVDDIRAIEKYFELGAVELQQCLLDGLRDFVVFGRIAYEDRQRLTKGGVRIDVSEIGLRNVGHGTHSEQELVKIGHSRII